MVNKKYILKAEIEKFEDGSNNDEHIKDIISEIDVLYGNIQDNNDICVQLFKVKQQHDADKDVIDAIQIACEDIIEIEKQASEIMKVVDKLKENLNKIDKNYQKDLENLLKQIKNFEKKSKKIMESVLIS